MKQYSVPAGSKEVLRDGVHFADARSHEEASTIATAMNEQLATMVVELGQCSTCKGVGAHEPNCVDRPARITS